MNIGRLSKKPGDSRKRLLLLLTRLSDFRTTPLAATLAWVCRSNGWVFDAYYDSYHEGVHFPGGDWRDLDLGKVTGGTVCTDRHFEEFYLLLLRFDVAVVVTGESVLAPSVKRLEVPVIADNASTALVYRSVFAHFGMPLPKTIVMVGANLDRALKGMEAFLTPEIWLREALGVHETISDEELKELCEPDSEVLCSCVHDSVIQRLRQQGYRVQVVDRIHAGDDYSTVTKRMATRWADCAGGWLLGDPVLACHWIPKSCEDRLVPIYGIPQQRIIRELADLIRGKGSVVYGRQSSDHDFFALSRLNQSLQVVDPCRPPFQSVRHLNSTWINSSREGFFAPEYSDEELRGFRREKKVLVSLVFWSGMIRELVNLYPLMDLISSTRLRCGLVLTSESFEYMMHPPLELLTVPLEDGGVYPLVEVLLGSTGAGVAIESVMDKRIVAQRLAEAMKAIKGKVPHEAYAPRGWWGTMDTDLEPLPWWRKPRPVKFFDEWPWLRLRIPAEVPGAAVDGQGNSGFVHRLRAAGRAMGLSRFAEPLRPYEGYRAGGIDREMVDAVKSAGLQYMFTKAGFKSAPEAQYIDDEMVALNYTAGQWDGWTPFETVNSVRDLRQAEDKMLRGRRPGWIVSTIDTCQWTFGGELWKKAPRLLDICRFCSSGGKSGRLLNVKPFTLARYARIMAQAGRS